jgi:very-short-patch-repair endonuclease
MNKKEFIEKAEAVFGNQYSYELVPEKVLVSKKVPIVCRTHGTFYQVVYSHLRGYGCQECARRNVGNKISSNTEEFIAKANKLFNNKYDYSKVDYSNNRTKVEIICPEHGSFLKTPNNHLNGQGCPICGIKERSDAIRDSQEDFIRKAKEVHRDLYDYSRVSYKSSAKKVVIICKKHGPFMQLPGNHISGQGCPICRNSKGENEVYNWLLNHGFDFDVQKKFKDCVGKKKRLPFDFYIPGRKVLIEYDGKQHFENNGFFSNESWDDLRHNDDIKNQFAAEKGLKLIRIKYTEKVDKVLSENLL